ncbi:hypothetical protein DD581_20070 [Klebsiella pneumoniae]|nr:hypothetical protein DD581_20070 [Klebsiella pneumoniae]
MRPIPLLLILSALALPALSQAAVRVEVVFNRVCAMQLLGGHGNARSLWEKEILPRMKVRRQLH